MPERGSRPLPHQRGGAQTRSGAGLVEVADLSWRPFGRRAPVLDDLSLTIAPGRRVLLAGASGSGKSTLLRALAGVLDSAGSGESTGTVLVNGRPPAEALGSVGLVLQEPGSALVATSLERDVAFGLENLQVPNVEMGPRVALALAEVGLTMHPRSSTLALSGGEMQRLALAGALVLHPSVLLLDEPTAMLDDETAESVRQVIDALVTERGLTLVVAEHRLEPWVPFVDDLLVLGASGTVVAHGPVREVLEHHAARLLAEGVWVPDAPDPVPADFAGLFDGGSAAHAAPSRVPPGEVTMAAERVRVTHHTRLLHGPARWTRAIDGLDFGARAGALEAVVGPSGSGKSSLLSVLAGLVTPDDGAVRAHPAVQPEPGRAQPSTWSSRELATVVSWVPQNATRSFVAGTVVEELLATSAALGHDLGVASSRASALVAALGLEGQEQTDPRRLSGGEQRRLAVAAAALHEPDVFLADEPTVGQDRHTWAVVVGIVDALRRTGAGVVLATHDPNVVSYADSVTALPAPGQRAPAPEVARTLVERVGPLAALLSVLVLLPIPALVDTVPQALAVLLAEALWSALALTAPGPGVRPDGRVPRLLARLLAPVISAAFVAWSSWLLGGHDLEVAATAGLRVLSLIAPGAVVLPYVDPDALGDQLCRWVRIPARPVVVAGAVLGRFQALTVLWAEVVGTRRVKGLAGDGRLVASTRSVAAATLALLVGALASATTLAVAMDARGFAAVRRRTWFHQAVWRVPDSLAVVVGLSVVLVAAVTRS